MVEHGDWRAVLIGYSETAFRVVAGVFRLPLYVGHVEVGARNRGNVGILDYEVGLVAIELAACEPDRLIKPKDEAVVFEGAVILPLHGVLQAVDLEMGVVGFGTSGAGYRPRVALANRAGMVPRRRVHAKAAMSPCCGPQSSKRFHLRCIRGNRSNRALIPRLRYLPD